MTFKNHELLRGVSWDVKRGERVGLVGEIPIPTTHYPNGEAQLALLLGRVTYML